MSELARAVSRMLAVYGPVTAERVEVYVEAVLDEHLCERCAAEAVRMLTRSAKRRPTPADLLEETRSTMTTGLHAQHVPSRAQLAPGEVEGWWRQHAPRVVRSVWPDLDDAGVLLVCRELQRQASCDLLRADEAEVAANLGTVDERGPSAERRWWERYLAFAVAHGSASGGGA